MEGWDHEKTGDGMKFAHLCKTTRGRHRHMNDGAQNENDNDNIWITELCSLRTTCLE